MTERRPARRRSSLPGWLASLAGATALLGTGFAAGLVAGVAFEDPGLVVGFVTGETESVELAALEPQTPAVSSPPPLGAAPEPGPLRAPPRPAAAPPAARRLPAVSAAAPAGSFLVQVGAFAERGAADRLEGRLHVLGLPVFVEAGDAGGGWRVRVGPFAAEAEARRVARLLKDEQKLPTWVLRAERARAR